MTLYRVADFADVPENRGLEVQVGDRKILLLRAGDQLRAYQGECPHAGRRWPKAQFAMGAWPVRGTRPGFGSRMGDSVSHPRAPLRCGRKASQAGFS